MNFVDVERALSLRPSVFTEQQRKLLKRVYGLEGDAPATVPALAKECGITRARARQAIHRAVALVELVLKTPQPPPLPIDNEMVPEWFREYLARYGITDLRKLALQQAKDLERCGVSAGSVELCRELLAKHGLCLMKEEDMQRDSLRSPTWEEDTYKMMQDMAVANTRELTGRERF